MSKKTFSQIITGEKILCTFYLKVSQETLRKILTSLEMSAVLRYLTSTEIVKTRSCQNLI